MLINVVYCGMGNLILTVAGIDRKAWDINYFDVVRYEPSGNRTVITFYDRLNNSEARILTDLTLEGFSDLYNQAKVHVEYLQTITFNGLKVIQQNHYEYFNSTKEDIKEYLIIHWTDPVQVEFYPEKKLPMEIKDEILEKFQLWVG